MTRRFASFAVLAAATFACGSSSTGPVAVPGAHNVLFIGNSLTYTNDLPAVVAAIATQAGDTLHVGSVTGGNLALIDHTNGATNAMAVIDQGGWEYVVMQQGPTSTGGVCQDTLVLAANRLAPHIRAQGGIPAMYEVWPAANRLAFFDNVRNAYAQTAASVQGLFMPAGEAWRAAWAVDPGLPLYGPDSFHPSPMGTYLAALTIYQRVTGRDPRTLPDQALGATGALSLAPATVQLLQQAAFDANAAFPAYPTTLPSPSTPPPQPITC